MAKPVLQLRTGTRFLEGSSCFHMIPMQTRAFVKKANKIYSNIARSLQNSRHFPMSRKKQKYNVLTTKIFLKMWCSNRYFWLSIFFLKSFRKLPLSLCWFAGQLQFRFFLNNHDGSEQWTDLSLVPYCYGTKRRLEIELENQSCKSGRVRA